MAPVSAKDCMKKMQGKHSDKKKQEEKESARLRMKMFHKQRKNYKAFAKEESKL